MDSEFRLRGLIVCLPEASIDDYVGVIETLIQEGLSIFALPAAAEAFTEVLGIFGPRADFGAYRVSAPEEVAAVARAGARFVFTDVHTPALVEAAAANGLPVHAAAMTPSEVRAVLQQGVAGALIWPADVVGHALGNRLAEVGLADRSIAFGGIGAYAAGEWLKSGSPAVCVDSTLLGDAFAGGSLVQLRDRCGSFVAIQDKHAPAADGSAGR